MVTLREHVFEVLSEVVDPEIPAVSVLDLGIVQDVAIDGDEVEVTCLPTFVGCPALEAIREDIEAALTKIGVRPTVKFVFSPPWTTDRITPEGLQKLTEYGLAPPPRRGESEPTLLALAAPAPCPYCGSKNTVLEVPFGPTLCRATSYCRSCRNPFEQFKQL